MQEKREAAHADFKAGLTLSEIARKHDLKLDTVKKWKKRYWIDEGTNKGTRGQNEGTENQGGGQGDKTAEKPQQKAKGTGKGGKDNLIPLDKRTKEVQMEIQSKGGKASGKSRLIRRTLQDILQTKTPSKITEKLVQFELLEKGVGIDLETARQYQLVMKAVTGDLNAIKYIDSRTGLDPRLELDRERLHKEIAVDYDKVKEATRERETMLSATENINRRIEDFEENDNSEGG